MRLTWTVRGTRLLVLLLLLMVGGAVHALPGARQVVRVTIVPSTDAVHPGDDFKLAIVLNIDPGYHIQANVPSSADYIATTASLTAPEEVSVGGISYPDPQSLKLPFEDKPLKVYSGQIVILAQVHTPATVGSAPLHFTGSVHYQACNDQACLAPVTAPWSIDVPMVAAGAPVHPNRPDLFESPSAPATPAAVAGNQSDAEQAHSALVTTIAQRGWVIALLLIFVQGLSLDLTPCVYPLIPITLSFFGSQSEGDTDPRRRRTRTFLLASTYVLGMCTTYSLLGVTAALTGHLFGAALQSPIVLGAVAATFFALSLSMLGAYELTVPSSIASLVESKKGVWGALFMGLFVGIVAAPCVGPFVIGLVTLVGQRQDPVLGFWLFFTMALGMGMPFLVLGWFSGSTKALPRSGAWMVWIKKLLGLVMMGIAVWYLRSLIPAKVFQWLLPAFVIGASIWIGFLEKTTAPKLPNFATAKRAVGILGVLAGLAMAGPWQVSVTNNGVNVWGPYSADQVTQAAQDKRPVIIDFGATWCTDCTHLETATYSDPKVVLALKPFVLMKADLTNDDDPKVKALYKQYNIQGLPTVVFLGPDGQELPALRLTGFELPDAFLQRLSRVPTKG